MIEPVFIYYNDLKFDKHKKFTINFRDEDFLEGVVFRKNRDYYITCMTCYITKLPKYDKIKEIHNLATVILRGGIDFSYGKKALTLVEANSGKYATFKSDKSRRSKCIERVEFFDVESRKTKAIYIYSPHKELKEIGLKFLNTDRASLLKSYTVKLSNDLKFWTRFFNDSIESFIDTYAREFDRNNVIFVRKFDSSGISSGLIPFKFDFTKEYIKQFLLSTSPPSFKNFVQKSIESKTQTSRVITTFTKFIKEKKGYYGAYINNGKTYFLSGDYAIDSYIPAKMYRKVDRTIFRTLDKIGDANPTAKVIDESKKKTEQWWNRS